MAHRKAIPAEERLFSLVLALLETDIGLTKHDILSTVRGYAERYNDGGDNGNLERQFERDKDDIRELGVPLETIESPGEVGNNQLLRYRIPREGYELPSDIQFTPEEAALLSLAAVVWREGEFSAESSRALLKLRGLGATTNEPVLGYVPRLRARDHAFEPLRSAIERHRQVRFDYLKPGQLTPTTRTVEPLALFLFQGRWHCYSNDPATGIRKTFLLRRIVSIIETSTTTFTAPDGDLAAEGLAELLELWQQRTARISVEAGTDSDLRLRKRRDTEVHGTEFTLHYVDIDLLADELTA
ncbi:MAG TPA: WYL domain-containing protein, partial [Terrimesophilobacter sp.]|nr:WYL domain-containing protein [Terrimesophilobacter sp.]